MQPTDRIVLRPALRFAAWSIRTANQEAPPVDSHQDAWESYRKRRERAMFLGPLLMMTTLWVVWMAADAEERDAQIRWMAAIVPLTLMRLFCMHRWKLFRCPRCRQLFNGDDWKAASFVDRCKHCRVALGTPEFSAVGKGPFGVA